MVLCVTAAQLVLLLRLLLLRVVRLVLVVGLVAGTPSCVSHTLHGLLLGRLRSSTSPIWSTLLPLLQLLPSIHRTLLLWLGSKGQPSTWRLCGTCIGSRGSDCYSQPPSSCPPTCRSLQLT
jgi:hypothetical protein